MDVKPIMNQSKVAAYLGISVTQQKNSNIQSDGIYITTSN